MARALYIQYTNPAGYPPLQHSSRILASAGWQVLFLGTSSLDADNLEFPPHPNLRTRKLRFCRSGWRQKLHFLYFHLWLVAWTLRWRPKWIYASDPLSCPAGLFFTFWPGLKVIYHEHDSPAENAAASSRFVRAIHWTRRKLAQRAVLNILPNEHRVRRFATATGTRRPVRCVWNCPATEDVAPARGDQRVEPLCVYYHGNLSRDLLPPAVLQSMAHLRGNLRLLAVGYTTLGNRYDQELMRQAQTLGLAQRVTVEPPVPRMDLLQKTRRADVGLALMPKQTDNLNFQHMVGASNKVFDYLASGLALLVSDLPEWNQAFVEPGYALACDPDDPDSIAAALKWFQEHPLETRAMGERGRQRILRDWNYEAQFAPVLEALERAPV